MEEYKGIYYRDEVEQHFYEAGAHFKYSKLCKILEKLAKERNAKEKGKEKEKELLYNAQNNKNNLNKIKRTRNNNNYLDDNKFSYNTIGNNQRNDKYNKKLFLSINRGNIKEENKNNFSLLRQKKDIDSRNKDNSINEYKCRPNTLFKDKYYRMLFFKNNRNRLLSSSVEEKSKNKNKNQINIKNSLPELNSSKMRKVHNYNTYKKKDISINRSKINRNNNIRNLMKNDIQQNIYNLNIKNNNKTYLKTERLNQPSIDISHRKIRENYTEIKDGNRRARNFFLHHFNFRISEKTHSIINKRILNNKDAQMHMQKNRLLSLDLFNKSRKERDHNSIYFSRSNRKKNFKKDFNIHNNTFLERTNFKTNKFYSLLKDPKKKYLFNSIQKDINNKYIKLDNNILLFNKRLMKRSRNEKGNNISLRDKNTFNLNNNINNKSKAQFNNSKNKNNYKALLDLNNTYSHKTNEKNDLNKSNNKKNSNINYNYLNENKNNYKLNNKKKDNNEASVSYSLNEISRAKNTIGPYKNIRKIKRIKYKIYNNEKIT